MKSRPISNRSVGRRTILAALVWLAISVLEASPASAHANLIGANPAPGATVPQAPGVVVLHFSEAVDHSRSTITVTDPGGRDATAGPTQAVPHDGRSLQRPLGLEHPGRYQVTWTSVSLDDGHVETGRYDFGIGTPALASRRSNGGAASSEGLPGLLSQLVLVAGLSLWVGAIVLGQPSLRAGVAPAKLVAARQVGPALVLVGVAGRVAVAAASAPAIGRVVPTILAGRAGALGVLLMAVAAAAGLLANANTRTSAPAAGVALVAQVGSGHAGAGPLPVIAVAVLVVHVAAASVWFFAVAAALLAERLRRALAVLSPYAVAAAVAVATTGLAGAALERVGTRQLLTTGYGHVLVVKSAVFVAVAGLGGWHTYRRRRRAPSRRLRTPVRLEAGAAGLALVAATLLAGSAPPTSVSPLFASSGEGAVLGRLCGNQALSIADATGPYVVGLTIAPARAGPVKARVDILSAGGRDVFSGTSIHATGPDGSAMTIPLHPAGAGTFAGDGRIERNGSWSFGVSFRSGGVANQVTLAASLPAPDGGGELAEAFAAEDRLTSARLHETLRGAVGSGAITADYQFQAPESLTFTVNGTSQIYIGALAYRQDQPKGPWSVESTGVAFGWPSPYFHQAWADATAVRIVGSDIIDGAPSHIVAFVRPDIPAWFELWVGDADGLVRREEMWAEGHLMQHDYSGFDAPSIILRPR